MRIEVYEPSGGGIEPVRAALALVGVDLPATALEPLTRHELLLAYDWAWRMHLRASDNHVRTRVKPAFLGMLEDAQKAAAYAPGPAVAAWERWLRQLEGSQRYIGQDLSITIGAARTAIAELSGLKTGEAAEDADGQVLALLVRRRAMGATRHFMIQTLPLPGDVIEAVLGRLGRQGLIRRQDYGRWTATEQATAKHEEDQ